MSSTWKSVRVFISSTFRDMHAERDYLVKVTFPRLRQWCDERRLHFVDIDLRWGVTKEEADEGKALEICLREIDGCRPFFLCLLGSRYGWVPEALPPEERYRFHGLQNATHLSITHLEILHAALSPLQQTLGTRKPVCEHVFFYLRDPHCLPTPESLRRLTQPQRDEYARTFFEPLPKPDAPDRRQMLADLKNEIRQRYESSKRVFEYSGRWDVTAENPEDDQLLGRLTELAAFGERVEADLKRSIEAQFTDHIAALNQQPDAFEVERSEHDGFVENRTQVHVPRLDLEQRVTQYVESDVSRPLVLSGPPGSGKSTILAHWVMQRARGNGPEFLVARFIGASPSSTNLHRLLANVCEELRRHFDLQEAVEIEGPDGQKMKTTQPMEVPTDPAEVLRKWPQFLKSAGQHSEQQQCRVILVMDALNQLDRSVDPQRLYWLPRQLPRNVRLIVSCLDHGPSSDPDRSSPQITSATTQNSPDWLASLRQARIASEEEETEVRVQPLSDAATWQVIRELPSVFCKTLDESLVARLLENPATRNPLFLTVALEELRVFGSFDKLAARIDQLPRITRPEDIDLALDQLFGQVLDRLDREASAHRARDLVPTLFQLLASAKEGLFERELSELLSRKLPDLTADLRDGELQIVLRQIRPYLMRKAHPQGTLLDFYHRSFWKAVRAKANYLPDTVSRRAAHRNLAEFFEQQDYWLESLEAQRARTKLPPYTPRPTNLRKIDELLWQHLQADQLDHAASLLQELNYLEAKNEAGQVFDLCSDYRDVISALPISHESRRFLKLLGEALRRDVHFVHRHCADFPQGLFQSLWNSGWWYDSPDAMKHYLEPDEGWGEPPPWLRTGDKLFALLELWLQEKESRQPDFSWIRCLRPPQMQLGSAQRAFLSGHGNSVSSVACSPDGRQIISGSVDQTIRVWDAVTGEELAVLKGHESGVMSVACSSDGRWIVSGSWDKTVRLWDADTGLERSVLNGHEKGVDCVGFSVDCRLIVSGSSDNTVRVWDVETGEVRTVLSGHEKGVKSVAFSHDRRWIVSGSRDDTVRVWDAETGTEQVLLEYKSWVHSVVFSADGRQIISGLGDGTVRVWNAETRTEQAVLRGHEDSVKSVAISSDGRQIISGSEDNTIRVWDAETGEVRAVLSGHGLSVETVVFSPDCQRIVSGSWDFSVRVWDTEAGLENGVLRGHEKSVMSVTISPDGRRIASGSLDHSVRVWDTETGENLAVLTGHSHSVESVAFSTDGLWIVSRSLDGTVRVWDSKTGKERTTPLRHGESVMSVAISGDGRRIVSGSFDDTTVRVWNAETGEEQAVLSGHEKSVETVLFSPDCQRIVSGSLDKTVRVWDIETATELSILHGHEKGVVTVAFSPDGGRVVSGSLDKTVRVWDAETGAELSVLRGHENSVTSVVFFPDGRRVVSSSEDRTVRVWDFETKECLEVIHGIGDVGAIAREAHERPWRAIRCGLETVVETVATAQPVAWLSLPLWDISTHTSGRLWAGGDRNYLGIIQLEGAT